MDSASSRVGIRHVAEDRRMSGQNRDGEVEEQRKNNSTMQSQFSENVREYARLCRMSDETSSGI